MDKIANKLKIDVTHAGGIVRVRDGADTWLCLLEAWRAALDGIPESPEGDDETADAYQAICDSVRAPVASLNGSSAGDWRPLVRQAVAVGLLEEEDAVAFGASVLAGTGEAQS